MIDKVHNHPLEAEEARDPETSQSVTLKLLAV